jgi:hypothetical protein
MPEVDYVPFATGVGANVYTPAAYQALPVVTSGVVPGLADPQLANTTWRLNSMMSAALANFISQKLGIAVLDDGNLTNLITNLTAAISAGAQIGPSRTIALSSSFNILTSDFSITMARVTGLAATTGTLPSGAFVGQRFKVADGEGNFNAFPVTIAAPGGHSISQLASVVLNVNHQAAVFEYTGNSLWTVEGVF